MRRGGEGQASLELALALPLVALLLLAVAQLGLLVADQVVVVHAAREAVRRAAVDPAETGPRLAATGAGPLDPARLRVELEPAAAAGAQVTVRLSYRAPTEAPIIGALLPDIVLHSRASMRREYS